MKTLSKEAETQLLSSVRRVVDLVEGGDDPTSAVAKVAEDQELPRGYIPLLCNAYNIGRVNAQRKLASDSILEKFADLTLADAKIAEAKLYPEKVETPAELHNKTAVDGEYSSPPRWMEERRRQSLLRMRERQTEKPTVKAAAAPVISRKTAMHNMDRAQRHATYVRAEAADARDQMLNSFERLTGYFRKQARDRMSFSEIQYVAESQYGDVGERLMHVIASNLGVEKTAAFRPKAMQPVVWTQEPYSFVKACVDCCNKALDTSQEKLASDAQVKSAEEEVFGPVRVNKSGSEKQAVGSVLGGAVGSYLTGMLPKKPADPVAKVESHQTALDDPDHDSELKNIQVQAMLHDLMMNDEVLKGYEPHQVINAYNDIAQTAPVLSMHSLAIRPLLRRHLQGNWEAHETGQTLKDEHNFRELQPTRAGVPHRTEDKK